jgi:hypothetical protein
VLPSALTLLALVTSAAGSEPLKLASPGFRHVDLPPAASDFYSDHFAQELTLTGLHVITPSEMAALLSVAQQKQLLDCAETSQDCMAELAKALGMDALVTGTLAKLEGSYQIDIQILSARDASVLSTFSSRVEGDKALLDELGRAAQKMSAEVTQKVSRPPPPEVEQTKRKHSAPPISSYVSNDQTPLRTHARIPLFAGMAVGIGGVVTCLLAKNELDENEGAGSSAGIGASLAAARSTAATGKTEQVIGITLLSVGGVGVLTGMGMWVAGGGWNGKLALVPTGNGLAVGGVFP